MADFISLLSAITPGKRNRLSRNVLGPQMMRPSKEFLSGVQKELTRQGAPSDYTNPDLFLMDVELDSLWCAATAVAAPEGIHKDRGGLPELDGLRVDFVLAYRRDAGCVDLLLGCAKLNGRWSGRRMRRLADRFRRIFGEEGAAFPFLRPSFIALGPERPQSGRISSWPAWMKREDDVSHWLPYLREEGELKIVRCDKNGRNRAFGRCWKLDQVPVETP